MIDKSFFYTKARELKLFTTLTQSQVDSINTLMDAFESKGYKNLNQLAYILATTKHETNSTFLPIQEMGSNQYLSKYYTNPTLRKNLGNLSLEDAWRYKGRGYVQITGRANYTNVGAKIHQPLSTSPELALNPKIAAEIAVEGMMKGWFTGKKLDNYIGATINFREARRIINSLDKADLIASYAKNFVQALKTV